MAALETLILDGLDLNGTAGIRGKGLEWKPARKILEWVKSADADGAKLLRPPKHDMAQMTIKLAVDQEATMDAALALVQAIVDKLQKAERISAGGRGRGIELQVGPAGSTSTGTAYVQAGEVEDLPRDHTDGWFLNRPRLTIRLDCHPFVYSDEVVYPAAPATDSTPLHTLVVPNVGGDVDAEARLIFTDMASQSRDYVPWFLENAGYQAATNLLIDSDAMVVTGMAGAQTTRAGAWDVGGGNTVIRATLTPTPVAVCSTAEIAHIGVFDNLVRVYASAAGVKVRLAYRVGRGQWTTLSWVTPPKYGMWCEVDLGRVILPEAAAGTQGAVIRFEAMSDTAADTIDIDYDILGPIADVGGGTARRLLDIGVPTVFSVRDEFNQSAGALTGKSAPVGGLWGGSGDSDDFTVDATADVLQRTATTDVTVFGGRAAFLSSVTLGNAAAMVDFTNSVLGQPVSQGLILRYTASTSAVIVRAYAAPNGNFRIEANYGTAGFSSSIVTPDSGIRVAAGAAYTMAAVLIGSTCYVWLGERGSTLRFCGAVWLSTLPATGSPGIYDVHTASGAATRTYDNFSAWVPEADAACFSGRSIEFRGQGDDACVRYDSTGAYLGTPSEYRGARFALPPGTSRVAVMARRNDIGLLQSENVTDGGRVQVAYRERRLVLPA